MERQSPHPPYRIGLALSGGGARGFAHIGVYKAMEELGICPGIISGTSAGSITGAMFASGRTAEEAMTFFKEGELIPRIIASSSVPIVFSPMTIDGFQYVDGGVFMNLPVRPIRDLCEVVIGVHIDPVEPNSHVKNMLQMAERSFHMGILSNMNEDTRLCDVVVMPKHISQYNMFDLSNMDILYEEGYKQALTVFSRPKVKALLGIQ